jgi:hypothetical protein
MSAHAGGGKGGWRPWRPPDCEALVREIASASDNMRPARGKYRAVQVQGDGDSIRRYRRPNAAHGPSRFSARPT